MVLRVAGSSPVGHPNQSCVSFLGATHDSGSIEAMVRASGISHPLSHTLGRPNAPLAQRQSNGLLIRRFWVRNPGGAPEVPSSEALSERISKVDRVIQPPICREVTIHTGNHERTVAGQLRVHGVCGLDPATGRSRRVICEIKTTSKRETKAALAALETSARSDSRGCRPSRSMRCTRSYASVASRRRRSARSMSSCGLR